MKSVGLSIDVDSVASHLAGYGLAAKDDGGAAYRAALPRILGMLDRLGARATFFLVADDARRHPDIVDRIARHGHEVASHSMTHRLPFSGMRPEEVRLETIGSRVLLRELSGQDIRGFRAPSWDAGEAERRGIVEAGYEYDASSFPSLLLPALRWAVSRRSANGVAPASRSSVREAVGPASIRRCDSPEGGIANVPMCTTPVLRIPYYHTLRFVVPGSVFNVVRFLAMRRRVAVWYQFHAIDFLGREEDRLDERIVRHPGMRVHLDQKLALAEDEVRRLARLAPVLPLGDVVDCVLGHTERCETGEAHELTT